jgi:release factor glutamine methyltransferase
MYVPAEDTQLLAECVRNYRGKWALEIGVGSGAIVQALAENFDNVAGSDIDLDSLKYCKFKNNTAALVCCDAASAFRGKFDLIVSNPPYLPDDDTAKDATVHGGPKGIETTMHFIKSALPLLAEEGGRMLVIVSSLADQSALDLLVQAGKLKKRVVKEKALFYERLSVIELTF